MSGATLGSQVFLWFKGFCDIGFRDFAAFFLTTDFTIPLNSNHRCLFAVLGLSLRTKHKKITSIVGKGLERCYEKLRLVIP